MGHGFKVESLKSTSVGISTPQKLSNTTNCFLFSPEKKFTSTPLLEPKPTFHWCFQPLRYFKADVLGEEWLKLRILVPLNVHARHILMSLGGEAEYIPHVKRYFSFHLGSNLAGHRQSNFKIEEDYLLTGQYLFQPNADSWGSFRGQNKFSDSMYPTAGPLRLIL